MDCSVCLEWIVHRHLCDSLPYFLQSFLKCCFLSVTFLAMVAKLATSPSDTLTFFPAALLFLSTALITINHVIYFIYLYFLPFSLDYRLLKERDIHIPILFSTEQLNFLDLRYTYCTNMALDLKEKCRYSGLSNIPY